MQLFTLRLAGVACLLVATGIPAWAEDRLQCQADPPPAPESPTPEPDDGSPVPTAVDDDRLRLEAGSAEVILGGIASLRDGVSLRRSDFTLEAQRADYDPGQRALALAGSVRYGGPDADVESERAEFNYDLGRVRFEDARFGLMSGGSRGEAGLLQIDRSGELRLEDVSYTTCPPDDDDWVLLGEQIRLDTAEGVGTARDVRLEFMGVPILYAPWLSFPISPARKSGFLIPDIGSSGRSGTDISMPYYWNIATNYDATITPRLLTRRGLQLATELRMLTRNSRGFAEFEYLPKDDETGADRSYMNLQNRTILAERARALLDVRAVSDDNYFEDLGGSLSEASTTHLNQSLRFDYPGRHWYLAADFRQFQTIDSAIPSEDEPYRQLPRMVASGHWPVIGTGLSWGIDSELTYFDRDVGVTGWRLNARPGIEYSFERPGLFLRPAIEVDYVGYGLGTTGPDQKDSQSRTLPIYSLDMGAIFERSIERQGWIQTLEPRALYVHIPYAAQSDLPVFDTIEPDLNLIQVFRKNRFVGPDRLADTDQVNLGVTTRLLNAASGVEVLRATIGQIRYLSAQGVSLPGLEPVSAESSDYIAELGFDIYGSWNLDFGHQWNSDTDTTTRSEIRLQYRPKADRVLNFAYRFRRGSVEQADVSWSWPVGERWNVVGRYNYSLRDQTTLERFFGVEYESCCWAIRLVSRRYISRRDSTADSSIAIQLELKGMSSVGDPADKLLERGILGYSRD
ncbi:MAG: LPS assembly protein LptD [Gammaproteobacteria bacterium]